MTTEKKLSNDDANNNLKGLRFWSFIGHGIFDGPSDDEIEKEEKEEDKKKLEDKRTFEGISTYAGWIGHGEYNLAAMAGNLNVKMAAIWACYSGRGENRGIADKMMAKLNAKAWVGMDVKIAARIAHEVSTKWVEVSDGGKSMDSVAVAMAQRECVKFEQKNYVLYGDTKFVLDTSDIRK